MELRTRLYICLLLRYHVHPVLNIAINIYLFLGLFLYLTTYVKYMFTTFIYMHALRADRCSFLINSAVTLVQLAVLE